MVHQGRGIGADLLRDRLDKVDAKGIHAYLESSNVRNISFYQRHGFEVVREIRALSALESSLGRFRSAGGRVHYDRHLELPRVPKLCVLD
jgi:ribosomal protein S18 acetylase RimI-like enzyme